MKQTTSKKQIITFTSVAVIFTLSLVWWLLSKPAANNENFDESKAVYAGPFKLQVLIDPLQPKVGNNDLTIIVFDKNNKAVTDATIEAVSEMAAMGSMPAMPAPAAMQQTDSGVYQGTFELLMNGSWPLSLDINSASTGIAHLEFDLTTSRSGLRLKTATDTLLVTKGSSNTIANSSTKKALSSGRISMDARRRQLIGVTTGKVTLKKLTKTIRAAGKITYDETRLTDISLKYNGWIGTIGADFVGVSVIKGKSLFTVYSPELLSAQQEYLETFHRRNGKRDSLLRAARLRLTLWNISLAQIEKLEKRNTALEYLSILSPVDGIVIDKNIVSGSAVHAGQKLLRIADLSSVWVEGEIYEYEIPLVKVGMLAQVVFPEVAANNRSGTITYIAPYLEANSRTAKVRVELDNADGLLKPNMYAHLHLSIDLGERLLVPESAVLYAGTSRVVFLDLGDGMLQPRRIKTGLRNANDIEVLQGLNAGDIVVTSGNFLIAAESKLKAGIDQW